MTIATRLRGAFALSAALGALLVAPGAQAQGPPPCSAGNAYGVTFTVYEDGERAPLVATHDVRVLAEWSDDAALERPQLSVPEGVRVLDTRPRQIRVIAPVSASLAVTAAWTQPADPSNPDSAARCAATQTTALPVLATERARAVYGIHRGGFDALSSFAVLPDRDRADLSPLTITARVGRAARFPPARVRARTMTVPMRRVDERRYSRRLPGPSRITTPVKCRLFSLTCGRLTTDVYALAPTRRGTRRELRTQFGELLSRRQPRRRAAPNGVRIHAHVFSVGFRGPRTVGYDITIRQSGALLARVRRAARCRPQVVFSFKRLTCRVQRSRNG